MMINQARVSGEQGKLEDKVGSFEIQLATNDITSLTRYSSNIAIYANVHVLVISFY